jgi:hypothetical protein
VVCAPSLQVVEVDPDPVPVVINPRRFILQRRIHGDRLAHTGGLSIVAKLILAAASMFMLMDTPPLDRGALGWLVGDSNGYRYRDYGGSGPALATSMRIYPDDGLGPAILVNGTELDRAGLAELLKGPDW